MVAPFPALFCRSTADEAWLFSGNTALQITSYPARVVDPDSSVRSLTLSVQEASGANGFEIAIPMTDPNDPMAAHVVHASLTMQGFLRNRGASGQTGGLGLATDPTPPSTSSKFRIFNAYNKQDTSPIQVTRV